MGLNPRDPLPASPFSTNRPQIAHSDSMRTHTLPLLAVLTIALSSSGYAADAVARKSNVIILLADDLGYADLGCQGSKEVISPNIDSIAKNGVRCTAGYVSAPQCCPSRAGLITGRYQNRFGFEANPGPAAEASAGLPVDQRTIADRMKAAGYVTGMVGKWHLGRGESFRPYNRGFDETFWHPSGGILFPKKKTGFLPDIYRGADPVQEKEYSTDAFAREAVAFIDRHQKDPFFLYVAFVPPHWPMEAKDEDLAKFSHIPDLHRRTMLAMMSSLDANVGRVLKKIKEANLEEDTLVFFLSDNGGPTGKERTQPDGDFEYGQNTSKNDPCRGVKGQVLEGGIRIPFLAQWKGHIPAGSTYDKPVISLDIASTALALAGVIPERDWKLDGTNLVPFLTGKNEQAPHDTLYWRFRFPPNRPEMHRWAIRSGDWKLVKDGATKPALYQLSSDISESKDLAAEKPELVEKLSEDWNRWDSQNQEPLWEGPAKKSKAQPPRSADARSQR